MNCYDDIKLQEFGIGFTNMCARTTKGSSDLKRWEINPFPAKKCTGGGAISLQEMKNSLKNRLVQPEMLIWELCST